MTKKSRKRPSWFEKQHSGCMWSLINIFDSSHGSPSQKLLPDSKHVEKRIVGTEDHDIMVSFDDSCEIIKEPNAGAEGERPTIECSKMSVKELMEEEMVDDQDHTKRASFANGHANTSHGRTRSKIDLDPNAFVAGVEVSDLSVMVEEFCSQIHEKDVSCFSLGHESELSSPSCIEEKLCEATKVLVDHFTDRKSYEKIQSPRELVEALQILNSNKDVFLKLLRDPNSLLAEHLQSLQDVQVLEHNSGNGKPRNFWKMFKGLERNSSKKSESSQDLDRIVILQPRSIGDYKGQIERVSSPFSFTEIKRKLKHAMRKEQLMINRDNFFIKRIPRLFPEKIKLEHETVVPTERRVYNIYVEAKKHLAEIVGSGDVGFDTLGEKQAPKALGRTLSFTGDSSSTIFTPRTDGVLRLSLDGKSTHEAEICVSEKVHNDIDTDISSKCSEEECLSITVEQEICDESGTSSTRSASEMIKDVDVMSDATSKPSPVSVLDLVFKEDDISLPVVKSFQPREIHFELDISASSEQISYNRNKLESNKYTYGFVKAVVQMSGLIWDKLLRRFLFSDHLVDPKLIDEVDFLPDLLPCDFNLLFSLINEVLTDICRVNFGSTLSFAKPRLKPELKGKDILTEIWKSVNWYLKLDDVPLLTLNQIIGNDFGKAETWMDLQFDCEGVGIQIQEAIIEELLEELMQDRELVRAQMALQTS